MEYPTRTLVSEPFVNQIEVIEKALIELQNQPSSYYGRRNRPASNVASGAAASLTSQGSAKAGYKYGYYSQPLGQGQNGLQAQGGLQAVGHSQTLAGMQHGQTLQSGSQGQSLQGHGQNLQGLGLRGARPMDLYGGFRSGVSGTTHIPQVFEDDKFAADSKRAESFSTFDPFGSGAKFDQGTGFAPLFNSSMGTHFPATTSSIWGSTNKGVAGDAAVWG